MSRPLRRSTYRRVNASRPAQQVVSDHQPWQLEREVTVPCRSQLGSASVGAGSGKSESFGPREVRSFVGVLGFRVERLQNLVSGVWLKKRASVAAEVSGRGLARGGKTAASEGTCRERDTAGETPVEVPVKSSRRAPCQRKTPSGRSSWCQSRTAPVEAVLVVRAEPALCR